MARRFAPDDLKAQLRAASPMVVPSLLASDFTELRREIERVEEAGARALHLDVMDGHFVPNISLGVPIVESVRRVTKLPLDVHLMIENPERYVEAFRDAGADGMTIHIEAVPDPRPLLDKIRALGALAGLSLNPPTPLSSIEPSLPHCDLVLVMSVMPGFGGQKFDPRAYDKLRGLRDRDDNNVLLEVDGGVNAETVGECAEAGAELLVAGVAVFETDDYTATIRDLQSKARLAARRRVPIE
jgi:ribulose-phosphate 3-epimerase